MSESITYRMMKPADAEEVSALVCAGFDDFIAGDLDAEGIAAFRRYADPEAFRERSGSGSYFVLVAEVGGRIAGITEFRDRNHVALLFVGRTSTGGDCARAVRPCAAAGALYAA